VAAPNPSIELSRLDKLVRAGLPSIVMITGDSDFFRGKAMERLLKAVPKDAELRKVDGADLKATADEDDADAGAAGANLAPELQDLRGGGLFAKTSFVVVRRGANWWKKHSASIAALAEKIPAGSGLLLESAKVDKRKKVAAALVKQLVASGQVFEFRDLYELPYDRDRGPMDGELCKWVLQVSKKLLVPLEAESALLLIAQVGKMPGELLAELERLRDQFGTDTVRSPLAPKDLVGKLTVSFASTPFEFAEAVLSGKRQAAQRSLTAMFARGVKQQDGKTMDSGGLLPFTSSWLFREIGKVYEGRLLLDRGTSMRDLAKKAGVFQFADRFLEQVKCNTIDKLNRGVTALHACQRKSRMVGEDAEVLLERFLAQWFDGAPIETAEEFEL
jgi:DNA polymerase III delta subunit